MWHEAFRRRLLHDSTVCDHYNCCVGCCCYRVNSMWSLPLLCWLLLLQGRLYVIITTVVFVVAITGSTLCDHYNCCVGCCCYRVNSMWSLQLRVVRRNCPSSISSSTSTLWRQAPLKDWSTVHWLEFTRTARQFTWCFPLSVSLFVSLSGAFFEF